MSLKMIGNLLHRLIMTTMMNDDSNSDNDFEVGGEEDELDEDSDAANNAITQFLFDDKNFYVEKEGDYRGDVDGRTSSPFHAQQPRRNQSVGCRRFVVTKQ